MQNDQVKHRFPMEMARNHHVQCHKWITHKTQE